MTTKEYNEWRKKRREVLYKNPFLIFYIYNKKEKHMKYKLINGDCLEQLKRIPDNSIDSIVTDPPAGISFMGKEWDDNKGGRDQWIDWMKTIFIEVKRVLKPGGHGLVWSLPRTSHWTGMALEDAGFDIRDNIAHMFGTGFPKSHNIQKSADKKYGEGTYDFSGQGTGLKPSREDWWLIRKPISEKSIVDNVIKHGVGGINIDKSRVPFEDTKNPATNPKYRQENNYKMPEKGQENINGVVKFSSSKNDINVEGRFPANTIHDGSEEVMEEFDKAGVRTSGGRKKHHKVGKTSKTPGKMVNHGIYGEFNQQNYQTESEVQKGSASRFFYCSKPSPSEKHMGLDDDLIISIELSNFFIPDSYNIKKENIIWETQDQKVVLQVDMDQLQTKDIEEYGLMGDKLWNIDTFMNYIMEQFQKKCTSITKTTIQSTITLKTLNSLIQQLINDFIQDVKKEKMVGGSTVHCVEKQNTNHNSTLQKKDGCEVGVENVGFIVSQRVKQTHPTVKSVKLMSYLINMITPPGGVVIDPFLGSGTTGISALLNGYKFLGIEMNEEYIELAEQRIKNYEKYRKFL